MKYLFLFCFFVIPTFGSNIHIETSSTNTVLVKSSYVVGYSETYRQALWCAYILTSNQLCSGTTVKRTNVFMTDPTVTNSPSAREYLKSGFDKGHLCPAQDRSYNVSDMAETFYMTNISPQEPSFNRGIWKTLEEKTRQYAILHTNVVVVCGPVLWNRYMCITNNIAIPQAYYKIIVDNDNHIGFVIPNQTSDKDLKTYAVPLAFIESITSVNFTLGTNQTNKSCINLDMLKNF